MSAPNAIPFRFNPSSSKSKKVLGPLECDIMEIVWNQGRTTVSAVHKALREKRDLAYTTVMTTMSRDEFNRYVVMGVIKGLIDDYGEIVGDCFVECLNTDDTLDKERVSAALCK